MTQATKTQRHKKGTKATASLGFCFLIFTSPRELFCEIWCFGVLVAGINKPQKHKGTKKAQKQLPRWDFVFRFSSSPGTCFVKFGVLVFWWQELNLCWQAGHQHRNMTVPNTQYLTQVQLQYFTRNKEAGFIISSGK